MKEVTNAVVQGGEADKFKSDTIKLILKYNGIMVHDSFYFNASKDKGAFEKELKDLKKDYMANRKLGGNPTS